MIEQATGCFFLTLRAAYNGVEEQASKAFVLLMRLAIIVL